MPKKLTKQEKILNDTDFWDLFLRLLHYPLTAEEIKYLVWRFYNKMKDREIAKLDDRKVTRQVMNLIIQRAYKKIKYDNRK